MVGRNPIKDENPISELCDHRIAQLCLLMPSLELLGGYCYVSPKPSLLQYDQVHLPQPLLTKKVLQSWPSWWPTVELPPVCPCLPRTVYLKIEPSSQMLDSYVVPGSTHQRHRWGDF